MNGETSYFWWKMSEVQGTLHLRPKRKSLSKTLDYIRNHAIKEIQDIYHTGKIIITSRYATTYMVKNDSIDSTNPLICRKVQMVDKIRLENFRESDRNPQNVVERIGGIVERYINEEATDEKHVWRKGYTHYTNAFALFYEKRKTSQKRQDIVDEINDGTMKMYKDVDVLLDNYDVVKNPLDGEFDHIPDPLAEKLSMDLDIEEGVRDLENLMELMRYDAQTILYGRELDQSTRFSITHDCRSYDCCGSFNRLTLSLTAYPVKEDHK